MRCHQQRQSDQQAVEPRLEQEPDQVGPEHAGPADDEKDQREHDVFTPVTVSRKGRR